MLNKQNVERLKQKKLFLFDIDCTLAVGDTLYQGSARILDYIERIGGKAYFITNNSTKSGEDYVKKFRSAFGLETTEDQFITSGYMTQRFLLENFRDKKMFVLGTRSFLDQLKCSGLQVTEEADTDVDCVTAAYDSELTYEKLIRISRVLQTTDAPFYATNPDLRCPVDFGFVPDCGAICRMITDTVGKTPVYLGKPSRQVVDLCLKLSGFGRDETLVVGDRLYTDIACGINGEVDTCVVFTGEARPEDMKDTPFPASFAFSNIKELSEALLP